MVTKEKLIENNKVGLRKSDKDVIFAITKNTDTTQRCIGRQTRNELLDKIGNIGASIKTINLIVSYIDNSYNKKDGDEKLSEIVSFVQSIKPSTASSYFLAIASTEAIKELTSTEVFEFAESVGEEAAGRYFEAIFDVINHREAIELLTSTEVREFAKSIGKDAALAYFDAIDRTDAVRELTSPGVLATFSFVESIGKDDAGRYFEAVLQLVRGNKGYRNK